MANRRPVWLVVLIQPSQQSTHVAAIDDDGALTPLLRSEADPALVSNLDMDFDSQLSLLRHRIAGLLQRGCDRLFACQLKARHIVLIATDHFSNPEPERLTERLAEHFVAWMMNPPATYLLDRSGPDAELANCMRVIAGELPNALQAALRACRPELLRTLEHPGRWEPVPPPSVKP